MAVSTTAQLPAPKTSFLDLAPPHWAARGLAYSLLIAFVLGAIASVAITMPEKVTAQFVLVPVRGADPVKATRSGVVAEVLTAEGRTVAKGDVIVTLKSDSAGDRTAEMQTVQTRLAGAGESAVNARARNEQQRLADEQEIRRLGDRVKHLDTLIAAKRKQLALTKQMTDSFEKLYREGIASQAQLIAKQIEDSELSADIERLVADQNDTRAELEKWRLEMSARQTEFRENERKFKEETKTNEIRAGALQAALVNTDGNQVRLIAPCSGTILKLRVKDGGAVVNEGETVAELACGGEQLVAELTVPEAGIGKLKLDQGVKLKYDAFPYQRYGVKGGKLAWLSPAKAASSESDAAQSFKARVELNDKEITVKGQPRAFAAGMSGTAEIVVGKRTLISYVFEPIRQLRENLADAP
ncbi:MAG TPA: HlyD family efflux transporter periplasmic adaptor subunit [Blastocatellia bacterium]|nr:HlyD family efflux transporter periplasmic adaptor subunit [Blastocatellia bacterium]HMV86192.1 HlyD family efflux transporter periplasmic adaptor subunit [Blastocatellia bacterium]HMX28064.1 HlyD family efflux transporter periplasmic adaptor subunit [Blastocatellia bacterium]HMY70973.1 HlyD family efflux transporter periplasmic adaptor subunit [Blastocatellia bacterium]HMZ18644.1 HlyD family efflux transporter periplasmic adaptor subunit [Blastocatellia bacterium]